MVSANMMRSSGVGASRVSSSGRELIWRVQMSSSWVGASRVSSSRERSSMVSANRMSFSGVGANTMSSSICIDAMTKINISFCDHDDSASENKYQGFLLG